MAHGEPGSPGCGVEGVVAALAERGPDGVDRRQVDDVEAHLGDRVQPVRGGPEACRTPARGGPSGRSGPLGAGEELVPGAVQGPLPVHDQRHPPGPGHQLAQRVGGQHAGDLRLAGGGQPVPRRQLGSRSSPATRSARPGPRPGAAACRWAARLARGRQPHPGRPDDRLAAWSNSSAPSAMTQLDVLAARHLDARVVVPVGDRVRPGLDPERPVALAGAPRPPRRTGRCPVPARASSPAAGRCRPGRAAPRRPPTAPCPSRNTVALTWNVSPATALAGRRPQSTAG